MTDIVERLESVEFMGMPDGVLDYSTASEAAARIKALEARIAKADALAEALSIFAKKANLYDGAPPPKYWGDTSFKLFYHWDEKVQFEVELGTLRKARAVIAAYREGSDT